MGDEKTEEMKIVLIGSSGGGTATLGHTNTSDFVRLVSDHLGSIQGGPLSVILDTVLFVSLDDGAGFDSVTGEEPAKLLFIEDGGSKEVSFHDSLDRINDRIKALEESIANRFRKRELHGLISVSCKPDLFSQTFEAAADHQVPVTGTGGSSLAMATSDFKIRLIGNSGGSVGTTPETKAISFASAFSEDWNMKYDPWKSKASRLDPPSWKSVLNACLPGFWSIALLKRLIFTTSVGSCISDDNRNTLIQMVESHTLPILCAVIMATSRRKVESVQMSAVIGASTCRRTILGGLMAGWIVANLEQKLLYLSILKWKLPATSTNLITGGLVGIFTAALMTLVAPYLSMVTEVFRQSTMTIFWEASKVDHHHHIIKILLSSAIGCLFCYGSKMGWYHSVYLPIILVEMELGDASMFGTLDLLTLVLVCAGICFGLVLVGSTEERALAKRGVVINLLCGDFIEACYPHMEQNFIVNACAYIASSLSAAILTGDCKSSAYLPFPLAIWLADDRQNLLIAATIAFFIPFCATIINHMFTKNKKD